MTLLAANPNGRLEGIKVNMKQAQQVHKKLVQDFATEYNIPVNDITGSFGSISDFVEDSYRYLGEASQFSQVAKHTLETLRDSQYEQFLRYGVEAQEAISEAMYNAVIAGEPFSSLLSTVQGILTGHEDRRGRPMILHAKQHAFDSVMNFNNQANLLKSSEIGIEHFLYVGNVITTTRQFCARRVEKIYTREQIEAWNDMDWAGKAGPAMTHRGGYNCRHHWRGVKPEWFDLEKDDDIPTKILEPKKKESPTKVPTPLKSKPKVEKVVSTPDSDVVKKITLEPPKILAPDFSDSKEWLAYRSEWVAVDNIDDAKTQLRNKYKYNDFEFDGNPVSQAEQIRILNEVGETMAGSVRKCPGLSSIIADHIPLETAKYWTDIDSLHENYFQLQRRATQQRNIAARRAGLPEEFVPTSRHQVNQVYGYRVAYKNANGNVKSEIHFVEHKQHEFGLLKEETWRGVPNPGGKAASDRWYTLRHEYGHHIQDKIGLLNNELRKIYGEDFFREYIIPFFSQYGKKMSEEMIAETFAIFSHPSFDHQAMIKKLKGKFGKEIKIFDIINENLKVVSTPVAYKELPFELLVGDSIAQSKLLKSLQAAKEAAKEAAEAKASPSVLASRSPKKKALWKGEDLTLPKAKLKPTELYHVRMMDGVVEDMPEFKFRRAWSRDERTGSRTISFSTSAPKPKFGSPSPKTIAGGDDYTGMALRVFDNGDVLVDEINSHIKGGGRKMIQALIANMPEDGKIWVKTDWSGDWWSKMSKEFKGKVFLDAPADFGRGKRLALKLKSDSKILYANVYADAVPAKAVKVRRQDMFDPKKDYVRVGIDENKKGIWEQGGKPVSAAMTEKLNSYPISNSLVDVIVSRDPNAKVLAFGKMPKTDNPKFVYSPKWKEETAKVKFDRVREFGKDLPKVRKAIEEGVKKDDPMAWLMYIEDRTAIRIGKEVEGFDTFGISSLQAQHIKVFGLSDVMIEFVGKGSKSATYYFKDPFLADFFKRKLNELPWDGQLFPGITDAKARNWIRNVTGNKKYKFHDFRTHHATEKAFKEVKKRLVKYGKAKLTAEERKTEIDEVSKIVSDFLHNLPETARENYIDPAVWDLLGEII